MDFYLTTWNTQGAALLDTDKKQVLVDIYKSYRQSGIPHLFIIQEAGSKPSHTTDLASTPYECHWLEPFDADNNRCTLGFIVPESFPASDFHWLQLSNAPRPVGICRIDNLATLACIHAVASHRAASEVNRTLIALGQNSLPWILGGDMNSQPNPLPPVRCRYFAPHSATHQRGKIYDYFYASTSISLSTPVVTNVAYSDHDPVTTRVTLW